MGQVDLNAVIRAYHSPRYKRLDRLERYVAGTQYEGLPAWMSDSDVPLLERAPCVIYPIAKIAIDSHVSLVLGEERWPTITSRQAEDEDADEDAEETSDETGLDGKDSAALDYLIRQLVRQGRIKAMSRKLLTEAMSCGTAVALVACRNGRLVVETAKAKWCLPTFTTDGQLTKIEIKYPYKQAFFNEETRKQDERVMLYRRVIDAEKDTVYKPAPATQDGREPTWYVDPTLSVEHKLGFVPAVWYKFMGVTAEAGEIDGEAIHAHLLDECHALNVSLSQRHKAALYTGDPQYIEIGVDAESAPIDGGQTARIIHEPAQGGGAYVSKIEAPGGGRPARRKGPGVVWRYPKPDSRVDILSIPGTALDAIDKHIQDLKTKLSEALSVLFFEAQHMMKATYSGIAISRLMARQTNYCDSVRDDFEHGCLLPLVDMCLRLVATVVGRGEEVKLSGLARGMPVLSAFVNPSEKQAVGMPSVGWVSPDLSCDWPVYYPLTAADQRAVVDLANAALVTGLITKARALDKCKDIFDIDDIYAELEQLKEEDALRAMQLAGGAGLRPPGTRENSGGMSKLPGSAPTDGVDDNATDSDGGGQDEK